MHTMNMYSASDAKWTSFVVVWKIFNLLRIDPSFFKHDIQTFRVFGSFLNLKALGVFFGFAVINS